VFESQKKKDIATKVLRARGGGAPLLMERVNKTKMLARYRLEKNVPEREKFCKVVTRV